MRIAVTGGMGKAGRCVVQSLIEEQDGRPIHDVVVFDQARGIGSEHVRYLQGDIRDLGQVYGALAGCDAVVHTAGVPRPGIVTDDVLFATNVIGTFNVHEAASRLGIRRVVTISSTSVLGWTSGSWVREVVPDYFPIDEYHPTHPQNAYGASKLATEAIVQTYCQRGDIDAVVLRPPRVTSPEETQELRDSNGAVASRFGLFHYIDARDLATACRLSVESRLAGYNLFYVAAADSQVSEPLSTLLPRLMPALGDKAASLTGTQGSISTNKIRQELGWSPKYSWRTGPL